MSLPELTLGIEEEYQIIDPQTRELHPSIESFLKKGEAVLGDQIKAELMQSQVEVGTVVCRNLREARQELIRLRKTVCELADQHGLKVAAASTHPFSAWKSQMVTEDDRYLRLRDDYGEIARRLLICGMHVHIGISDRELMIDVMNQALYFMPHILAISTSSPFWHGRKTELKSYRSVVFENLPRSGLPPMFNSYAEFERVVAILVDTNTIEDASKIWWDVRPHHKFPTLEFRIADVCTRVDEALCVAALIQAIVAKLIKLRRNNQTWRRYPRHLINENKWRAVKRGIEGQLIDFGKRKEVPVRFLALELLEFVDDVVDELGARGDVQYLNTILKTGTSADRQLALYEETGNFEMVVDNLIRETREGCE